MSGEKLENNDFDELEKIARQEQIKADVKDARLERQQEQIKTDAEKQAFDSSPTGIWCAVIKECVPQAMFFAAKVSGEESLNLNQDDVDKLATGLAPALAKHFPLDESFEFPVEITAIIVTFGVFAPKIQAIKAKRLANELKEVKEDATPTD